ncbi:hypothetical protein [Vallitalea sp.]|jgi:hypothetical protein|uniref:hypothetical protein n=1 Tax=Vallitalea sp. TaxID=1882829 RepID=UPI0025EAB121|nr:hypothetical protein [Vallitalea sp.]MCT4686963.1 hypothetical protein [Vallitalea sp.]
MEKEITDTMTDNSLIAKNTLRKLGGGPVDTFYYKAMATRFNTFVIMMDSFN